MDRTVLNRAVAVPWYWKINEGIDLLKAIRDELHTLQLASRVIATAPLQQRVYEPTRLQSTPDCQAW
jgi:hypothetical protein